MLANTNPGVAEPLVVEEARLCSAEVPCVDALFGMLDLPTISQQEREILMQSLDRKQVPVATAGLSFVRSKGSCESEGRLLIERIYPEKEYDWYFKQTAITTLSCMGYRNAIGAIQQVRDYRTNYQNHNWAAALQRKATQALIALEVAE